MKKLLALLIALCMLLALCACGAEEPQIQVVQEAAQAETQTASEEAPAAEVQEAEAAVSDTSASETEAAEEAAPAQEAAQPEAGSIGTVGGADGPTAVYTAADPEDAPEAPAPEEPAAEPEAPVEEEAAPAEPEEAAPTEDPVPEPAPAESAAPAEDPEEAPAETEAPAVPAEPEEPAPAPEEQEADAPAVQEAEPGPAVQEPAESQAAEPVPAEAPAETGGFALSQVTGDIYSALSITDAIEMPAARLLDLYGLQAADYTDASCFVTMAGIFPHEVVLVKAVDEAAAARLAEKLQNRLNEVRNQSASYDPENYALAQECSVDVDGLYVSMFLSPDHAAMRAVLEGYLD